jgi:hypothetical protein
VRAVNHPTSPRHDIYQKSGPKIEAELQRDLYDAPPSTSTEASKSRVSREYYEAVRTRLSLASLPWLAVTELEAQWQDLVAPRGGHEEALLFIANQTYAPMDALLAKTLAG